MMAGIQAVVIRKDIDRKAEELFELSPNVPRKWRDGWDVLSSNSRRYWRAKAREGK